MLRVFSTIKSISKTAQHTYLQIVTNGGYFATISIAQYTASPKVGGDFKIGVKHQYQGKGLGRLVILYGFSRLRDLGIKVAESSILITRKTSLHIHFSLGFKPQYNQKYFALPTSNKLYMVAKVIPLIKLRNSYKNYIKSEQQKYINK